MSRILALVALVSLGTLVLPPTIHAEPLGAQVVGLEPFLYRIDNVSRAGVQALLAEGVHVSRVVDGACFLFGDERLPDLLERWGIEHALLDSKAATHDYYLTDAASFRPKRVQPPARLLENSGGIVVLASPRGEPEPVLALGSEVIRLFPTPLRLPEHEPRTWSRAHIAAPSHVIFDMVSQVSADTLAKHVARLERFGTRNARKPEARTAAEWIAAKLRSYGIEQVEIVSWSAQFAGNVVATIPGAVANGDVYVVGGHYDSIVPESTFEPGADDNASGTATLLECARILAGQRFAASVRIVAFGGEEYGLLGSEAYASHAASHGERIVGMINLDMLGHRAPSDRRDLDIISNDSSNWLRDAARDVASQYVPELLVVNGKLLRGNSDHASFWRHGFDAVFFFEDSTSPSPFIHTINDVSGVSYNDSELHTLCTQTAVALLATLAGSAEVPINVQSFSLQLEPNGVRLVWELSDGMRDAFESIGVQRAPTMRGPYASRARGLLPTSTSFVDEGLLTQDAWYRLVFEDADGSLVFSQPSLAAMHHQRTNLEAVRHASGNGRIHIRFSVAPPEQHVRLDVYDVRGRLVRQLVDTRLRPGAYLETWDRLDDDGRSVMRGIYFVHLQSQRGRATHKVLIHKR